MSQCKVDVKDIKAIGISYQMHGLVCVDKNQKVLRPAIIWCDSRAVGIGENAFQELGRSQCLTHLLNTPGNFTASKLAWATSVCGNSQVNLENSCHTRPMTVRFESVRKRPRVIWAAR